jgi:hypothetical protein
MVTMTATSLRSHVKTAAPLSGSDLRSGQYVFCAGMPRSGSTWQYQIVSHLLEESRGGLRGGFLEQPEDFERIAEQTADRPLWLALKTHHGHPPYAQALREGRALAVYSYRDLRDVMYSLMHKMHLSFDEVLQKDLLEQCFIDHVFWTELPNVLCQRYEDIMADPVGGVKEIAAFLAVPLSDAEAVRLADQYSLEANRLRARQLMEQFHNKGIDLKQPENAVLHDEHTQLHWNHIRDGRVGSWRDEATPEQVVVLTKLCGGWLLENGYEADAGWVLPGVQYLCEALDAAKRDLRSEREQHARDIEQVLELKKLGPLALGVAHQVHRLLGCFPGVGKRVKGLLRRFGVRKFDPEAAPASLGELTRGSGFRS